MKDIMLDLEALSPEDKGILVSIGAVYFDIKTQQLGDEFYVVYSIKGMKEQQRQLNRKVSLDCIQWWMQQEDDVRKVYTDKGQHVYDSIEGPLLAFNEFCSKSSGKVRMWGNGADFDCRWLMKYYQDFDRYSWIEPLKPEWTYSGHRCYRTIKALFNKSHTSLERQGAHHNALDDAKSQALHLMKMLKDININT